MLRFVRTQPILRGVLIVWLVSYATMGITLRAMVPFPLPMYLVIMALSTLLTGALPYLADRLLAPRLGGFVATLLFPLAVAAMDFLSASTNPMVSIGAFAYSISGDLIGWLAVAGLAGMFALVMIRHHGTGQRRAPEPFLISRMIVAAMKGARREEQQHLLFDRCAARP